MNIEDRYNAIMAEKLAEEKHSQQIAAMQRLDIQIHDFIHNYKIRKKHTYRLFLGCMASYGILAFLIFLQFFILNTSLSSATNAVELIFLILPLVLLVSIILLAISAIMPMVLVVFSLSRGTELHQKVKYELGTLQMSLHHFKKEFKRLQKEDEQKLSYIQEQINWLAPRVKALRKINIMLCLSSITMTIGYFLVFSTLFSRLSLSYPINIAIIFLVISVIFFIGAAIGIFNFKFNK